VFDLVTAPIAAALGFAGLSVSAVSDGRVLVARPEGRPWSPAIATTAWGERLDSTWREVLRSGVVDSVAWCLCFNGQHVRLVDARRSYALRSAQLDLDLSLEDERAFNLLWVLLRRDSFLPPGPAGTRSPAPSRSRGGPGDAADGTRIARLVAASDRHTAGVCRSLRDGVLAALGELLRALLAGDRSTGRTASRLASIRRRADDLASVHEQALTIVYRVLFLLFAESRLLVPTWHSVYRDGYSLDAARALAERSGPATGLWEMLQAISRLSHSGCRAGDLRVTPFNGRLFSPAATPLAETASLDDEPVRRMLLALSTTPRPGGRARIVYRDLDVEQLGAVYESVLDYTPTAVPAPSFVELRAGSGIRKSTATFYTPRSLTTYLVRRTLAPLVAGASPQEILALRVVDPAMGSGAFLVAACRYLAAAYEAAVVESGAALPGEIGDAERRDFRRAVAQRCLYGADSNPMAVQLARLSIWLATLSPDRPLTFLDHRLVAGDSLVGASIDDLCRRPSPRTPRRAMAGGAGVGLPLFDEVAIGPALRAVLPSRQQVAERRDDTLADVREKERLMSALAGPRSPLARWRSVLDTWCREVSPSGTERTAPGIFGELAAQLLHGASALAPDVVERLLSIAAEDVARLAPLHWSLEFPEVFYGSDGSPLDRPGFDAVVGNPPWDMVRADQDGTEDRTARRERASRLVRFTRDSGIYRAQGDGHPNRFQLFVERALQLARQGGRVGLVVPWGLLGDAGSARLRRLLFDHASVDPVVGFDNGARIFPIHRGVRFLAFSATNGGRTPALAARFGERDPAILDRLSTDGSSVAADFPVVLTRPVIDRLSGESLAIPDVRNSEDLALLEALSRRWPALSSPSGWHAQFGRELNASDDRKHFARSGGGLPVLEGKHVEPFRARAAASCAHVPIETARRLLAASRTFGRARLAYRDVSCATNSLTLIAAVVPASCVTVHSLFCLRGVLPAREQHFLCGIFNSLVANYYVRFWVGSHVTAGIIGRLPVPVPAPDCPRFRRISTLARALSRAPQPLSRQAYSELQGEVARLYGLTEKEFVRVVESFPLLAPETRAAALRAFQSIRVPLAPLTIL
jgi:hypothetical protein